MSGLLGCPFCRELFAVEEAGICPECEVKLVPLSELPASFEVRERLAAEWEQTPPEDRVLPWSYLGWGRGALLLLALLGIALFFAPWLTFSRTVTRSLSGFELVSTQGFWFGGGAVAWLVLAVLVVTRRTLRQMRGARFVAALLAAVTPCQVALLLLMKPPGFGAPTDYAWDSGLYASALLGVLATFVALRFGGKSDPVPPSSGKSQATSNRMLH